MAKELINLMLTERKGASFSFHCENGKIIIDECEGMSIEDGLSLFPEWLVSEMLRIDSNG